MIKGSLFKRWVWLVVFACFLLDWDVFVYKVGADQTKKGSLDASHGTLKALANSMTDPARELKLSLGIDVTFARSTLLG